MRLFYDSAETVLFQVIDEEWNDQTPAGPAQTQEDEDKELETPYKIVGSMARDGLGVLLWWEQ